MKTVQKYVIPTDGQWHVLELSGAIVHAEMDSASEFAVWAEVPAMVETFPTSFCAFMTDDMIPDGTTYRWTARWATTSPAWHLYEQDAAGGGS